MATYYSDIAKKAKALKPSEGITDASFNLAGLVVTQAVVEVTESVPMGSTLVLTQPLSKGLALVPQLCVFSNGSGGKGDFSLGDEEMADRYFKQIYFDSFQAPSTLDYGVAAFSPAMCLDGKPIIATTKRDHSVGDKFVFTLVFASVA